MKLSIKLIYILLSCQFITSCSSKSKENSVQIQAVGKPISNFIDYDNFQNIAKLNDTIYKTSTIEILNRDDDFYFKLESGKYERIRLDGIDYNGPGYSFSLFSSIKEPINKLILIEAQSDIGTAWYYCIFIENNKICDSFLIKESRSNSELYSIDQFIKISKTDTKYIFRFKKKLVATYSKLPSDLFQEDEYYVLEKNKISQNETQGSIIKNDNHELLHIFYSNGGILAFYSDGTVVGCPQCDLDDNNIGLLKSKEPFATYKADGKSIWVQYTNGDKNEMKFYVDGQLSDDWAMKDGEWIK